MLRTPVRSMGLAVAAMLTLVLSTNELKAQGGGLTVGGQAPVVIDLLATNASAQSVDVDLNTIRCRATGGTWITVNASNPATWAVAAASPQVRKEIRVVVTASPAVLNECEVRLRLTGGAGRWTRVTGAIRSPASPRDHQYLDLGDVSTRL